jgi:hypothetical protein
MATFDIQMLRGKDGEYVIKELSMCCFWDGYTRSQTVVFLPPYSEDLIPSKYVRQNAYVTTHIHGLGWYTGDYPYSALEPILSQMIRECGYHHLFVKGEEKAGLLNQLLPEKEFHDIGTEGCPRLDQMPEFGTPYHHHVHWRNKTLSCAGQNAKRLCLWLEFYDAMQ